MSDDRTPGDGTEPQSPDDHLGEARAPWERALADPSYRRLIFDAPGPQDEPTPARPQPTDADVAPAAAAPNDAAPADNAEPTVEPEAPDQPEPDAPEPEPEPVLAAPVPHAEPQAVGTPAAPVIDVAAAKRHRATVLGRTAMALMAVFALVSTGLIWGGIRIKEGGFSRISALDVNSTDIVDADGQTGDETYLLVGTDSRAGSNADVGAGTTEDADGARADTIILVNIPANRSRVVAVSFPRDLDVERPACNAWDNSTASYSDEVYPAASGEKLNGTYALGGPRCLVKVIQKMSGLKIGHFVGVDFSGFESMVNTIGGVDICTTTPLVDEILGNVLPTAGNHHLDGATALSYVRARHVDAEGASDYGRITRQQRFLSALLRGAMSNKVLFNPGKLNSFIDSFTHDTFVENIDAKSLMTLARSLQNVDAGAVTFLTVPTSGTTEWGNEIPRTADIKAIFQAIINDEPLPGEERKSPNTPSNTASPNAPELVEALSPSQVSVQVSNASGIGGLAASTADSLAVYGFQIVSIGNYTQTSYQTLVRFSPGYEAEAATVASSIPGSVLQSTGDLGATVEVVVGSGEQIRVGSPARVGTLLDSHAVGDGTAANVEIPPDLSIVNAGDATCS